MIGSIFPEDNFKPFKPTKLPKELGCQRRGGVNSRDSAELGYSNSDHLRSGRSMCMPRHLG